MIFISHVVVSKIDLVAARVAKARHAQSLLLGKDSAVGLERLQPHMRDALTEEALTTSAFEREQLDPRSVRSSIARRLGRDFDDVPSAEGERYIEGLIDVLQDATLNT
jgi:hypothetical protein